MRRFTSSIVLVVALLLLFATSVIGQEGDTNEEETEPTSPQLTLRQSLPLSATVDIEINGEIYQVVVPVTLDIDAQALLSDANMVANQQNKVGVTRWDITSIDEYEEEYVYSQFRIVETRSDSNKLAVVEADITNLSNNPVERYPDFSEIQGVDSTGKLHELREFYCDTINPNATQSCAVVFEVSTDVEIVGLDLAIVDRKQIRFQPAEE